jgi:uncharacterized protein YciI
MSFSSSGEVKIDKISSLLGDKKRNNIVFFHSKRRLTGWNGNMISRKIFKNKILRRIFMFVILLNYIKPLDEVEKELEAHRTYLNKYYSLQKFICSGRQNPRVGGVILSNAENREEVETIIQEDPFYSKNIATYEIIEFTPTMHAEGFEQFITM